MDSDLLELDEFQVECEIRGLNYKDSEAKKNLDSCLVEEVSGLSPAPTSIHSSLKSYPDELAVIQSKLNSIHPTRSSKSGDPQQLLQCHSRLMHLQARILRVIPKLSSQSQGESLKLSIETKLRECLQLMTSLIHHEGLATGGSVESINEGQQQAQALLGMLHGGRGRGSTLSNRINNINNAAPRTSWPLAHARVNNPESVSLPTTNLPPPQRFDLDGYASRLSQESSPSGFNNNLSLPTSISTCSDPVQVQNRLPAAAHLQRATACPVIAPAENRELLVANGNTSQAWIMGKWPFRFAGGPRDLPVDEFIFRTETLARQSNLSQNALALGLHQILVGAAASWYWIFLRNSPNASWAQIRDALTLAFQSNVSDAAIRRLIADRLQRNNERFMDFTIAIQELEVRLAARMTEFELLDTLRRNMLPHVQDRLLFVTINSVRDLQNRVHQVEELAQRQMEVQQIRRSNARIHEIGPLPLATTDVTASEGHSLNPPRLRHHSSISEVVETRPNPFSPPMVPTTTADTPLPQPNEQQEWICAMTSSQRDPNQLTICWNCDDIGHTFMDCSADRTIFCYGCGTKNVIRPRCQKCSSNLLQGNGRRNARPTGPIQASTRSEGQAFQQINLHHRPS